MKRLWLNVLIAAYRGSDWVRARLLSLIIRTKYAIKT